MTKRALFGQFFKIDNLNRLTPQILGVVKKEMGLFSGKTWKEGNKDWVKVDVKHMFNEIFGKVVASILFNDDNVYIDGAPLSSAISNYVNLSLRANFNIGNLLTYNFLQHMGIGGIYKRVDDLYKKIDEICYEKYNKRVAQGPKGGVNLLDLMIEQNKNAGF